ncbi:type III PLP-dependent enzyme [Spirillospora sp. NPDC048911]|uniref:type III PLP-dependent enzyme n=1 Tax=Spirillospora sp. NPDC048911 TaxID=3364527 RepID=UPI0037111464
MTDFPWRGAEYGRLRDFLDSKNLETPYLVTDPAIAADRYHRIRSAFPKAHLFYAVKANPEPVLLRALAELGGSFDVASPQEIDMCLGAGIPASALCYGSTIKKPTDICHAYDHGIRLFAFDSVGELRKLAMYAPGASVFCRLLVDNTGAQWPLGRKFGCPPEMAVELLDDARQSGLTAVGVSFHVGSQQLDPSSWDRGIQLAAKTFYESARNGLHLELLNLGGGFPARYTRAVPSIDYYANRIQRSLRLHFGDAMPTVMLEPGRYISAEAGVIRSQVVLVTRRTPADDRRWVYLDIGRFGGLPETEGEAIRYPLVTRHDGCPAGPVILAGPTCDSADVLYDKAGYALPLALREGDHVDIISAGAYTATYSSSGFNGFPPLKSYTLERSTAIHIGLQPPGNSRT